MGPCILRNSIRDSPLVLSLRVDFLLRRFGPLLVKTKMNPGLRFKTKAFVGEYCQSCRSSQSSATTHGPAQIVSWPTGSSPAMRYMQRRPPTRMILTWYPARATGFSTSKPRQDDASSTHLQECLSMQQLNLKNTRLANSVHSRPWTSTADRGPWTLSRSVQRTRSRF